MFADASNNLLLVEAVVVVVVVVAAVRAIVELEVVKANVWAISPC